MGAETSPWCASGDRRFMVRRARLVQGAVAAIDELGFENTTAARIAEAAGLPRASFYRVFANLRECLEAVLELLVQNVEEELLLLRSAPPADTELLRAGVETVFRMLDGDPPLARVALIETASGGAPLRAARELALERVVDAVDGARHVEHGNPAFSRLAIKAAVAGVFWVAQAELTVGRPLSPLTDEAAALLAAASAVPRQPQPNGNKAEAERATAGRGARRSASGKPPKLRLTSRTLIVLERLAAQPGATNTMLAAACGNVDAGQMSKLLGRLERNGLIANSGDPRRKWGMNLWTLTPSGEAFLGLPSRPSASRTGVRSTSPERTQQRPAVGATAPGSTRRG